VTLTADVGNISITGSSGLAEATFLNFDSTLQLSNYDFVTDLFEVDGSQMRLITSAGGASTVLADLLSMAGGTSEIDVFSGVAVSTVDMLIGDGVNGATLKIRSGATVTALDTVSVASGGGLGLYSTGVVEINGTAQMLVGGTLNIGQVGTGSVRVQAGASSNVEGQFNAIVVGGNAVASRGHLYVDGANSDVETGSLTIIDGTVNVTDGGRLEQTVASGSLLVGQSGAASPTALTVEGLGSQLIWLDSIEVGDTGSGPAVLAVRDGASLVTDGNLVLLNDDSTADEIHSIDNATIQANTLQATPSDGSGASTDGLGVFDGASATFGLTVIQPFFDQFALNVDDVGTSFTTGQLSLVPNTSGSIFATFSNGATVDVVDQLLGQARSGEFEIDPGAQVTVQTNATVNAKLIDLESLMTVETGATVNADEFEVVGDGDLTVQSGAALNTDRLEVAIGANVTLQGGATATVGDALFGPSDVVVSGVGTQLQVTNPTTLWVGHAFGSFSGVTDMTVDDGALVNTTTLRVGDDGVTGFLRILNGGQVVANTAEVGTPANSLGSIEVTGGGSILTVNGDADFAGDPSGTGLLIVGFGGLADIDGRAEFDSNTDLSVTGGTLEVGELAFGAVAGGSPALAFGTVRFTQDVLLDTLTVTGLLGTGGVVGPGQAVELQANGTLASPISLQGGSFIVQGQLTNTFLFDAQRGYFRYDGNGAGLAFGNGVPDAPFGAVFSVGNGLHVDSAFDININADGLVAVEAGGTLGGSGNVNNDGELFLNGPANGAPTAVVNGFMLFNNGLLHGSGRVNADLQNGQMYGGYGDAEVRATGGQRLVFTGFSNQNYGTIRAAGGSVIEFFNALTNGGFSGEPGHIEVTGGSELIVRGAFFDNHDAIAVDQATLRTGPGGRLINYAGATLAFTGEVNSVFSDVTNSQGLGGAPGVISLGGDTTTTFFYDVHQDGQVIVADGSRAIFLGDVTGNGSFTGDTEFAALLAPGNSPGTMSFGNLDLRATALVLMEIAGYGQGTPGGYDYLDIAGLFEPSGILEVALIDGFVPQAGDAFDLFDFDQRVGWFDQVLLPTLGGDLAWDTSQLQSDGVLSVVPEPASLLLIGLGSLALLRRRG
jgi:fibronectin-binding autotransporter adhesin